MSKRYRPVEIGKVLITTSDVKSSAPRSVWERHDDLVHRWRRHASYIEATWQSLDRNQRARCMIAAGKAHGTLSYSSDESCGAIGYLIPELNLHDIAGNPDFLLNHLKHRATTTIQQQLFEGCNGGPGDRELIERLKDCIFHGPSDDQYTFFPNNKEYGQSCDLTGNKLSIAARTSEIPGSICVHHSIGDLIIVRQGRFMNCFTAIIAEILDHGPESEHVEKRITRSQEEADAVSHLKDRQRSDKLEFSDFIDAFRIQKEALDALLKGFLTDPGTLKWIVERWFCTQPGLIRDENGETLLHSTDKWSSACVFDVVQNHVKGSTTWAYIGHLLRRLQGMGASSAFRSLLLQELANCCFLEWERAVAIFSRFMQATFGHGHFLRQANIYDDVGNPCIVLKTSLDDIKESDSQRYLLFHIALTAGDPEDFLYLSGMLCDLWTQAPSEPSFWADDKHHVKNSFLKLHDTSTLIHALSKFTPLPTSSPTEGQVFVSKCHTLEVDFLNSLKKDGHIDLRDYCGPISALLRAGMAEGCLKKLDQLVTDRMGTTIRGLYYDLLKDAIADLDDQCESLEASFRKSPPSNPLPVKPPIEESGEVEKEHEKKHEKKCEKKCEKKRETGHQSDCQNDCQNECSTMKINKDINKTSEKKVKKRTRPAASVPLKPTGRPQTKGHTAKDPSSEGSSKSPIFKVKSSIAEFFWDLFGKSRARPSMSWKSFEAAMAGLGFSVLRNKKGSSIGFIPPEEMVGLQPINIHMPHQFQIEGYRGLILSRRLTRAYGWDETTFEVA